MTSWILENIKKAAALFAIAGAGVSEVVQQIIDWLTG